MPEKSVPETRWELHKLDGGRVEIRRVEEQTIGPFENREAAREWMIATSEDRKRALSRV